MERKFLSTLNVIGHMGAIQTDVQALLERIGAWDKYGKSGWGPFGNESIFASRSDSSHSTNKVHMICVPTSCQRTIPQN